MESSQTRNWTGVLYIARWTINHWIAREASIDIFEEYRSVVLSNVPQSEFVWCFYPVLNGVEHCWSLPSSGKSLSLSFPDNTFSQFSSFLSQSSKSPLQTLSSVEPLLGFLSLLLFFSPVQMTPKPLSQSCSEIRVNIFSSTFISASNTSQTTCSCYPKIGFVSCWISNQKIQPIKKSEGRIDYLQWIRKIPGVFPKVVFPWAAKLRNF